MASSNKLDSQIAPAPDRQERNKELPVLDREAMLATVEGDLELLRELVELFLAECPGLVAEMRRALQQKDAATVERVAHTLKGAVGNFGGLRTSAAARAVEAEARANRLDEAQRLLPTLEDDLAQVCRGLSAYLSEVAP
jgi:HPt (histidine-containing phosphotransfer) domain-containing protein